MTTNIVKKIDNQSQAIECAQYSVQQLTYQVLSIQEMMKSLMKKDTHYGCIPGCGDKPTLLKAGGEKLCLMFRLASTYKIEPKEFENGHREYEIICTLTHIPSGQVWGQGVGSASTLENRYRYRFENTNKFVPSEYWQNRDSRLLGGNQFTARKVNKNWMIFERIEHDNPADYYNTVLKMAKKRAQVDACLTATAASDIFNQDLEDLAANEIINEVSINVSTENKTHVNTHESSSVDITDYLNKIDLAQNKKELTANYEEAFTIAKNQKDAESMTKLAAARNKKLQEFKANEVL